MSFDSRANGFYFSHDSITRLWRIVCRAANGHIKMDIRGYSQMAIDTGHTEIPTHNYGGYQTGIHSCLGGTIPQNTQGGVAV